MLAREKNLILQNVILREFGFKRKAAKNTINLNYLKKDSSL